MKYPELFSLSQARLDDPRTYREIEYLDKIVLDDMVRSYSAFSRTKETVGDINDPKFEYRAQDFLWARGISFGERALIALGYFDDTLELKALPMLSDRNNICDYHPAIVRDYHEMTDSFKPAGSPDSLDGEVYTQRDSIVMATRTMRMLDERRSNAVQTLSSKLPLVRIVVSHTSYLMHDLFENGVKSHVEID